MKYLDVGGVGRVSRIGLGTWQFGSREWGYGDSYASGAAGDIVRRARPLGVTLFDTAEIYGLGKSERILGEALGDERAEVAVASKVFPVAGVVAIPGASSVEQLEFNVAAADIELSPDSRDALTDAARAFRPTSNGRFLADKVREKIGGH
jgi:aryl-alcohol dehydrogenase-like predicted oxidoreductase